MPHGIRALKTVTSSYRCDESYFNPVQAEVPVHSFGYLPFHAKSLAQEEKHSVDEIKFNSCLKEVVYGPGGSVGIVTELRAGRSGIEFRWGRDFPPVQTGPGAHPASCKMGTWSFPGVKCGRDVLLTTHPLLVPRSWKSRAIPLPKLWATPGL